MSLRRAASGLLAGVLLASAAAAAHAAPVSANALLGVRIADARGERLGTLRDLAVDAASGAISYAIVNFDEASAMAAEDGRLQAIPLQALRPGLARQTLVLDAAADAQWRMRPPASSAQVRLMRASTLLGTMVRHPAGARYGLIRDLVVDLDTAEVLRAVIDVDVGESRVDVPFEALRFPAGLPGAVLVASGAAATGGAAAAMRARELIGKEVRDPQGNAAGRVENLVVDIANNRVHYAVLDLQRRRIAYPLESLQRARDGDLVLPEVPERRHDLRAAVPSIPPRAGMALIGADELIGSTVESLQRADLGKLVDLTVDPVSGQVLFAVVDLDPSGTGERLHAIPLDAFAMLLARQDLVLAIDAGRLAPEHSFTRAQFDAGLLSPEFIARQASYVQALGGGGAAAAEGGRACLPQGR